MDLTDTEVLVIGMKRSGQASAELLQSKGARVRMMDQELPGPDEQAFLASHEIPFVKQSIENLGEPDLVVISPAVPIDAEVTKEARLRGVPVIGEVELASYYLKGPIIGITGSNGKTTTTALTGHILRQGGVECLIGGNIGTAVTSLVAASEDHRWNVLELSSFQLETIYRFRAAISGCLNVTPDHLDRHHTFAAYANAKGRLFEMQVLGDSAVLNYEDPICHEFARRTKAEVLWFSSKQPVPCGVSVKGPELLMNGRPFMETRQIRLRGVHNLENVMAAAMMARLAGVPLSSIGDAVHSFPGVEHRIEFVRTLEGVEYYNDSKATNVDAASKAIDAFPGHIWMILGGKDKGGDYRPLREPLEKKAKGVLLIGAAAQRIEEDLRGAHMSISHCGTLANAVEFARREAQPGDIVLLAPACASFDQFQNFEHRGNVFKQLVQELF